MSYFIIAITCKREMALRTALRTTTLSFGDMQFSDTYPAESPQPINMQFRTIYDVSEVRRYANNICNRLAEGGKLFTYHLIGEI
jgi:hypothetical protein